MQEQQVKQVGTAEAQMAHPTEEQLQAEQSEQRYGAGDAESPAEQAIGLPKRAQNPVEQTEKVLAALFQALWRFLVALWEMIFGHKAKEPQREAPNARDRAGDRGADKVANVGARSAPAGKAESKKPMPGADKFETKPADEAPQVVTTIPAAADVHESVTGQATAAEESATHEPPLTEAQAELTWMQEMQKEFGEVSPVEGLESEVKDNPDGPVAKLLHGVIPQMRDIMDKVNADPELAARLAGSADTGASVADVLGVLKALPGEEDQQAAIREKEQVLVSRILPILQKDPSLKPDAQDWLAHTIVNGLPASIGHGLLPDEIVPEIERALHPDIAPVADFLSAKTLYSSLKEGLAAVSFEAHKEADAMNEKARARGHRAYYFPATPGGLAVAKRPKTVPESEGAAGATIAPVQTGKAEDQSEKGQSWEQTSFAFSRERG